MIALILADSKVGTLTVMGIVISIFQIGKLRPREEVGYWFFVLFCFIIEVIQLVKDQIKKKQLILTQCSFQYIFQKY